MSESYKVTVTHETESGQHLRVEYEYTIRYGYKSGLPENCYPDETDEGEPTYFIDNKEVDYSNIPAELSDIFDAMAEESAEDDDRFKFKSELIEPEY